jgi:DeoR/GlpR family transcriptional regulator of sugar metabolism
VVADSSKFGRKSLTLVAPLEAIDLVVSDAGLSGPWRERIAAAGPRLLVTQVDESPLEDAAESTPRRSRPA